MSVKHSLKKSIKQMKLMREGKLPKKTLEESKELWNKWTNEEIKQIIELELNETDIDDFLDKQSK